VLVLQLAVLGHVLPNAGPYAFNSSTLMGLVGFVCTALAHGLPSGPGPVSAGRGARPPRAGRIPSSSPPGA
jgi:hypothetical protein